MNKVDRRIAGGIADHAAVLYAHQAGVVHRIANIHREGLTDKEYEFIMKRYDAALSEMRKLQAISERLLRH